MALNETQQILELVKKSKSILIIFKKEWSGDDLAGSLSLGLACQKMGKSVDIVCQDFKADSNLSFLPLESVQSQLHKIQKFVISLNTSKAKLDEFYYERVEDKLNIFITPKEGQFEEKDVKTSFSEYKYDLVFVVNTPDLESLGKAYVEHVDFFYSSVKVNIDHSPRNEGFGNINLLNLANSSTSEVIYDLIKSWDEKLIEGQLATCLLAGMIMATKNFKIANITPKTLHIASLLVAAGAEREQIVKSLYQNRKMTTLKLWGRILARLNSDLDGRLVWSRVGIADFLATGSSGEHIEEVIEDLITSLPRAEAIVLFYEQREGDKVNVSVVVYSANRFNVMTATKIFNPEGNSGLARLTFKDSTLAEVEGRVITEIKKHL